MPSRIELQTDIVELFEFLGSDQVQVRQVATENVASLTSSPDYHEYFRHEDYKAVKRLMKMTEDEYGIAHDAVKALVNLSGFSKFVQVMDNETFLNELILLIVLPKTRNADLLCMLLNNLSKHESVIRHILPHSMDAKDEKSQEKSPRMTSLLDNLIEVFGRGEGRRYNPEADFHFLSGVISNLTTVTEGANFMLGRSNVDGQHRLMKMIAFLNHDNLVRRGGVTSVIKNCCFDTTSHLWLLTDPDLNLLPYILLPLMGPEEYDEEDMDGMPDELQLLGNDKTRESDPEIRLILIETLLLLATTRQGRDILRAKKVYPILQKMHLQEPTEQVQEAIERLVQLIARDEAPNDLSHLDLGITEVVDDDE